MLLDTQSTACFRIISSIYEFLIKADSSISRYGKNAFIGDLVRIILQRNLVIGAGHKWRYFKGEGGQPKHDAKDIKKYASFYEQPLTIYVQVVKKVSSVAISWRHRQSCWSPVFVWLVDYCNLRVCCRHRLAPRKRSCEFSGCELCHTWRHSVVFA